MQPGLVSPVFVGRGGELAAMVAALESAVAGDPAVVLVGGEAGVGKTGLVEEATEQAVGAARECSPAAASSLGARVYRSALSSMRCAR
jgi:Cdc6-like AAA superfamily ATPase